MMRRYKKSRAGQLPLAVELLSLSHSNSDPAVIFSEDTAKQKCVGRHARGQLQEKNSPGKFVGKTARLGKMALGRMCPVNHI